MAKRSAVKEAALAYAAEGWPVLACYTNTDEGCSCGDTKCMSPGKHPIPELSPNGVNSATTDLDEIASWPSKINIGIALGHKNLMALDVDDPDVAAALLAQDTMVHDITGACKTGRGVHIYFLCTGESKTRHLRDKVSGRKIGHIAGVGAYCIAAPSKAPAGKSYRWLGPSKNPIPRLAETTDAIQFVKNLLEPHGFEPVPTASIDVENAGGVEVMEHELVDLHKRLVTDSRMKGIKQRMSGKVKKRGEGERDTDKDLSGWEWFVGCEILRTLKDYKPRGKKLRIDPTILAGILKKLDRMYYGKFESDVESGKRSRQAADDRYSMAAVKAMDTENVLHKLPQSDSKPILSDDPDILDDDGDREIIGVSAEPTYMWDEDVQTLFYLVRNAKSDRAIEVCNFQVKLLEEMLIDKDDGTPKRAWKVQVISFLGDVREVWLKSEEFKSTTALEDALSKKLTHEFIVSHNGYVHIKPAILKMTEPKEVVRSSIRAIPGWQVVVDDNGDDQRVFLLPSALGAITATGVDTSMRMRTDELIELDEEVSREEFKAYGLGVRPPVNKKERSDAWKALRALATCGPYEVTMPIILQVLMGPLWAAGADEVPSLLHVSGRTGVLKTSFCLSAMSLVGTFRKTTPPTASWPSVSPSALRSLLAAGKDLTILVDDYKEGTSYDKRGMTELIQAYADKATRQRLKSSGERRKVLPMQAVMLSNGEDRWERQASMVARTIFIDVKDYDIKDDLLATAQRAVDAGHVQLLGGRYLQWLCTQDKMFEDREIEKTREKWHRRLLKQTKGRDMHRRLLSSVATVAAVGDVFLEFVKECYPKHHVEAQGWTRKAINTLVFGTRRRAKEVKELAPLQQVLAYLASEAEANKVCLLPVHGINEKNHRLPTGNPRAEVVGWYEEKLMILNSSTTFGWYKREMKKQGNDVTFSWAAVVQEAKNTYGAKEGRSRIGKSKRQIRTVTMPLKLLNLDEKDEV